MDGVPERPNGKFKSLEAGPAKQCQERNAPDAQQRAQRSRLLQALEAAVKFLNFILDATKEDAISLPSRWQKRPREGQHPTRGHTAGPSPTADAQRPPRATCRARGPPLRSLPAD